ncbi:MULTISPECIES: hypothetical protein [Geobacter]|uniref:hypothetical protein n=1 Tax=Geobacter TaxID=28231 RepID=UPI0025739E00|nr:hypothetical protein [Geobacter sulfurreducens]BEH10963.1 hypothetical protein GSUET_25750 [Geobacter sulfurreducens subsp. ethanolicus]BET58807.1 hypothetical protein GEO60473_18470 [Geobacter sp. 60473]
MNLRQVSIIIKVSSRGSEETARAAHALPAFSEEFRSIVGRFRPVAWRTGSVGGPAFVVQIKKGELDGCMEG